MEIDLNQSRVRHEYAVHSQGRQLRIAKRSPFRLLPQITLYAMDGRRPILTVTKRFSFVRPKYDIQYPHVGVVRFETVSILKGHYRAKKGLSVYDIYQNQGRKYSIYLNDRQVAWWDKEMVSVYGGDNYKIIADDDCDLDLILAFCLIIDSSESDDNDNTRTTVHFDLGRVGPVAREFDPTWQPKKAEEEG